MDIWSIVSILLYIVAGLVLALIISYIGERLLIEYTTLPLGDYKGTPVFMMAKKAKGSRLSKRGLLLLLVAGIVALICFYYFLNAQILDLIVFSIVYALTSLIAGPTESIEGYVSF